MSLHLGNLSSRVRINELEHVFRRFGYCNVNLKDAYGFVVYDVPAHAEKALQVLRGKKICGEQISISWSKQQPRSLHSFSRGNRLHELQRVRKPWIGDKYSNKKMASKGRRETRDKKYDLNHQGSNGGKNNSENIVDVVTIYDEDNIKETTGEDQGDLKENYPDEDDKVQNNLMDDDRWEKRFDVPSSEFDGEPKYNRYDPYLDIDDKKDVDENLPERYSGSFPTVIRSQDKRGGEVGKVTIDNLNNSNPPQSCNICGELGHQMHSCSQEKGSRRKKLSGFDYMQDNDFKGNRKRLGSRSQERLKFNRDVRMRSPNVDRKVSSSMKHHRSMRSVDSRVLVETHREAWRKDYRERKRSMRENGTPDKRDAKKVRGPVSSSIRSGRTASRSMSKSKSSRSVSRSDSLSRSLSSKTHSPSSKSGPQSSRSEIKKSMARSRSRSPTLSSLSVSLDRSLPSLPNKTEMNQDDILEDATFPDLTDVRVEQETEPVQVDGGSYNTEHKNMPVENISAVEPLKEEDNAQGDHIRQEEIHNFSLKNCNDSRNDKHPDALEMDETFLPNERTTSEVLMLDNKLSASITKPVQGASPRSCSNNPLRISSEELCVVLKHYGLDVPGEERKDLPVEAYFGSARLWPWPVIYYRRLKKGSISTENYARRIIQNQEFGIVDKFVRSSSGWGELGEEKF